MVMLAVLCISCEKDKGQIPTAVWNTVERISGRYLLETVEIEGPGVDIDDDGVPETSLLQTILSQGYIGMMVLDKDDSSVVPAAGQDVEAGMEFYVPVGQVEEREIQGHDVSKTSAIHCTLFRFCYTVDASGKLEVQFDSSSSYGGGQDEMPTISFDEENHAVFKYRTEFFDFATYTNKTVSLTCRFRNTTR